jgi:mannose/fructose/N-acetylgalactosamine-specific phosphotransferase system component IID
MATASTIRATAIEAGGECFQLLPKLQLLYKPSRTFLDACRCDTIFNTSIELSPSHLTVEFSLERTEASECEATAFSKP